MNFGAIDKDTSLYTPLKKATKCNNYKCPDCGNDLTLCKGPKVKPYFRHKVDIELPCTHYSNRPNESQIHKVAKLRLKNLLEEKKKVRISRLCPCCKKTNKQKIPALTDKSEVCIEYKFKYKGSWKSADVAYLYEGKKIIFEVYCSNKTISENRPEPWFEFNTKEILEISDNDKTSITLNCIRDKKCKKCRYMEKLRITDFEKWVRIKLEQDFNNNHQGRRLYADRENFGLNFPDPSAPKHKRLEFNAGDDITNNKQICEIFQDDINTNKLVIHSYKGDIWGYIISNTDYNKYDYWQGEFNWSSGIPVLFKEYYTGQGTVDIIMDLVKKSKYIIPENNCKYTKKTKYSPITPLNI